MSQHSLRRARDGARSVPVCVLLALSACVSTASPAPQVPVIAEELVPAPPSSTVTLIWQPGHYDLNGAAYTWVAGEWVPRAGHGRLWQDGFWRRSQAQGWEWVPAHWI